MSNWEIAVWTYVALGLLSSIWGAWELTGKESKAKFEKRYPNPTAADRSAHAAIVTVAVLVGAIFWPVIALGELSDFLHRRTGRVTTKR